MTLTFLDLYNECASQPWSMYDADAESIDDLESALKISINKAISYLWNYQPWSFRIQKQTIKLKPGRTSYSLPAGTILKKTINTVQNYCVACDGRYLEYTNDYDFLDDTTGTPTHFYVQGETINFYPVPDESKVVNITYALQPYGLNEDYEKLYELKEETDYLNIPERYESLFKNCLISLAMMYAIADENDENYSGYQRQYEDSLGVLLKYCRNSIVDRNIVW